MIVPIAVVLCTLLVLFLIVVVVSPKSKPKPKPVTLAEIKKDIKDLKEIETIEKKETQRALAGVPMSVPKQNLPTKLKTLGDTHSTLVPSGIALSPDHISSPHDMDGGPWDSWDTLPTVLPITIPVPQPDPDIAYFNEGAVSMSSYSTWEPDPQTQPLTQTGQTPTMPPPSVNILSDSQAADTPLKNNSTKSKVNTSKPNPTVVTPDDTALPPTQGKGNERVEFQG